MDYLTIVLWAPDFYDVIDDETKGSCLRSYTGLLNIFMTYSNSQNTVNDLLLVFLGI